jgi:hypothetical protein
MSSTFLLLPAGEAGAPGTPIGGGTSNPTGKLAFSASINRNALSVSDRSPWRRRPRLFQEVPLHPHRLDLGPQQPQLLPLGCGRTVAAHTLVQVVLADPPAEQLIGDPELRGNRPRRLARRSPQLQSMRPVVSRVLVAIGSSSTGLTPPSRMATEPGSTPRPSNDSRWGGKSRWAAGAFPSQVRPPSCGATLGDRTRIAGPTHGLGAGPPRNGELSVG